MDHLKVGINGGKLINGFVRKIQSTTGDRLTLISPKTVGEHLLRWDAGMADENGRRILSLKASANEARVEPTEPARKVEKVEEKKLTESDLWQGVRVTEADVEAYIQIHFPEAFEATCDALLN